MGHLRRRYEQLDRSRNMHELSKLRDEIDMALIRCQHNSEEGKKH